MMSQRETEYQFSGELPKRSGTAHDQIAPGQVFKTLDGKMVMLTIYLDDMFQKFCVAVERPELAADPRFATAKARLDNREACVEVVQAIFLQRTQHEWNERLAGIVPYGPVLESTSCGRIRSSSRIGCCCAFNSRVPERYARWAARALLAAFSERCTVRARSAAIQDPFCRRSGVQASKSNSGKGCHPFGPPGLSFNRSPNVKFGQRMHTGKPLP
jgi:hypothetical protein